MRSINLLAVSLLPTAGVGLFPDAIRAKINSTFTVGPFNSNQDVSIHLKSDADANTITCNYYDLRSGAKYANRVLTFDSEGDLFMPLKSRISETGVRIEMNIKSHATNRDNDFIITTPIPIQYNVATLANKTVSHSGVFLYFKNNLPYTTETFNYENTNRYITKTSSNELDISEVSFTYNFKDVFHYSRAYLKVIDHQNIYPNVQKESDQLSFKVPMNLTNSKGNIKLNLNSQLYVNSDTLQMASNNISGYSKTSSLFIPIGSEKKISKNEFSIVIEEAGYNKDTIVLPLDYFIDQKMFGSCFDSEICIEGGIRK